MEFLETELTGVVLIRPRVFGDHRGFFLEMYHAQKFAAAGIDAQFVQDNLSRSARGVLRGLHYQIEQAQGKLVTCLTGEIFDVAVDLRKSSPQFGRWTAARLTADGHELLWIPPGFAHGFAVLSETADVFYKCTNLYSPQHERTVLWNDETIGIDWPLSNPPVLAEKDRAGKRLPDAECYA